MYRGRVVQRPQHLANAVKIIIHVSTMHTRRRRQRYLNAAPGIPPAPAPAPAPLLPPPPPPDVDTGVTLAALSRNQRVDVWWFGEWWRGRICHISLASTSVSVRFLGSDNYYAGIPPKHVRLVVAP